MPHKSPKTTIQCTYFTWRFFSRKGVFYADGRSAGADLGKHSLGTRNRDEAMQRLRLLDEKKAIELGIADIKTSTPGSAPLTIASGWERYLAFSSRDQVMGGASPGTIKRYSAVRDHHLEYCRKKGIENWAQFDKRQLEQFGGERGRTQADRTVYFALTLIKSVTKWLAEEKLIAAECRLIYPLAKPQGTDAYCYRPEEVAAMVQHCNQQPDLKWLADVIVLLAHTGLRISEAASLRWSDIDFNSGILHVADERSNLRKRKAGMARTTKGRRSRKIPIHPHLRAYLNGFQRQADGRVLHAPRGGKILPRNVLAAFIQDVIKPLQQNFTVPEGETGFEHGRLHSFRHYFCSQAFVCGASEGEVREWLGHADSQMVEHYRHLRSEDALRRMERINFLPTEDERPSVAAGYKPTLKTPGAEDGASQKMRIKGTVDKP